MNPVTANFAGMISAFFISFGGNATLTFSSRSPVVRSGLRYLIVAFSSFLIATAIMIFVENKNLPIIFYAITVMAVIPPINFLLAKFWVFAKAKPGLSGCEGKPS